MWRIYLFILDFNYLAVETYQDLFFSHVKCSEELSNEQRKKCLNGVLISMLLSSFQKNKSNAKLIMISEKYAIRLNNKFITC